MSPIVATVEADEATQALAEAMKELLWRDVHEEPKAKLIYDKHCEIDQDDYLNVWLILDAPTRRAWKAYVEMGKP